MSLFDVWWSAWIGILTQPRRTLRTIIDERPGYQLPLLALLTGITTQANSAITLHGLIAWQTWFKILIIGPISGFVSIYIGAYVLNWCGERVGGSGDYKAVRAATAWGSVPGIVLLPVIILLAILTSLFQPEFADMSQIVALLMVATVLILSMLLLAGVIWMFTIIYRCYAEALELGFGWTFVALLMSGIILAIPVYFFNRLMLLI